MSLSLGAQGIQDLTGGEWEVGLSYRYLNADKVFIGRDEQPQLWGVGSRTRIHSVDLSATYAFTSRLATSIVVPYIHTDFSIIHGSQLGGDNQRHGDTSKGLGDIRVLATWWVLDPEAHPIGNLNLGLGLKAPTGDYRATTNWYMADGRVIRRSVDVAGQRGDGGWGIVVQLQAFREFDEGFYGFVQGFYLINPRTTNGTTQGPVPSTLENAVPDRYFARLGVAYTVAPNHGISVSLGARIDGIPIHDLIGRGDEGFRRAGYALYVDPGISWVSGANRFTLNVGIPVERNVHRTKNWPPGAGGFADYVVVASYSHRF